MNSEPIQMANSSILVTDRGKMGLEIEVHIRDIESGRRVIHMYGRKDGDLARRNRAVRKGNVDHGDKKAAKNLVKEKDPESWQLYQKGGAGNNPDIILDEDTGEIILRPVIPGKKPIKTNVKPKDYDQGLYERLPLLLFVAELLTIYSARWNVRAKGVPLCVSSSIRG